MRRESLGLTWAITWRWTLLSLVVTLPLMYLRSIPHSTDLSKLYSLLELTFLLLTFVFSINWILNRGYGDKTVSISTKQP